MTEEVSEALVAGFEAEGELVDEGAFTIDREAALAKLRSFQLAEPQAFLLAWVEAAVLAKVDAVRITSVGTRLCVELGRRALAPELLTGLLEGLADFRKPEGVDANTARVLELLAIGCLAASGLAGRNLLVESFDEAGEGGALEIDAEHPFGRWIAVSGDPGLRAKVDVEHGEALDLLRERCRISRVPILLDEEKISNEPDRAVVSEAGRAGLVIAFCRLRAIRGSTLPYGAAARTLEAEDPARVTLICNGVRMASVELQGAAPGFFAIVDLDLPRDLSRDKLRESPELEALLAELREVDAQLQAGRGTEVPPKPLPRPWHGCASMIGTFFGLLIVATPAAGAVIFGADLVPPTEPWHVPASVALMVVLLAACVGLSIISERVRSKRAAQDG